jgi:AcrR family transcriptional regulator
MGAQSTSRRRRPAGKRRRTPSEQRQLILAATAELVAKRGYHGTTVELIAERAGISNKTFYGQFANREECLMACLDEIAADAGGRIAVAAAAESDWVEKVPAGIVAFLDYVVVEPARARTFLVESMGAGPAALGRYEKALKHFAQCLRGGRKVAGEDTLLPDILEDSIVGGIVWMVHQRLIAGELDAISPLLPRMVKFALASYLGAERAALIAAAHGAPEPQSVPRPSPRAAADRRDEQEPGLSESGRPVQMRPLRSGRASLPPELVARDQRERLLAALAQTVAAHGYNETTIAQITTTASISRQTFYEHFESKEECFGAAYDAAISRIDSLVLEAALGEEEWPDQVAAALRALLGFLTARPDLARLCFVEVAAVGEGTAPQRQRDAGRFITLLAVGRQHYPGALDPGEGTEEALLGGVMTQVTRRILGGQADRLESYAPELIEFTLAPYLGLEAARQIAARHSEAATPPS